MVSVRLNGHMSQVELYEPFQSAYTSRYSSDTSVDHITLLDRLHIELDIGALQ